MTPQRVDEIGQGRVWDGGTARQIGLVDRFGSLADAVAEAANRAKLDPAKVQTVYLEKAPGWAARLVESLGSGNDEDGASPSGDVFAHVAADRRLLVARAIGDVARLTRGGSVQARCLECGAMGPGTANAADGRLLDLLIARLGF